MTAHTERTMTDQPKRKMFAADSVTAPLRHSVFRRIWLASLLSNFGLLIQGVGAAWTMTQMTSSADKVALVQTALMLPIMLISMPAGAIADMYDRRIVALVSLSIALSGATSLSVMAWLGLITPQTLLAFCFVVGCGFRHQCGALYPAADRAVSLAPQQRAFTPSPRAAQPRHRVGRALYRQFAVDPHRAGAHAGDRRNRRFGVGADAAGRSRHSRPRLPAASRWAAGAGGA